MMLRVNTINIDIDNPANTTISLSALDTTVPDKSLTSDNKNNTKNIINVRDDLNEGYTSIEDFGNGLTGIKNWTNDKLNTYDTGIKDWTNNQISSNNDALKNWVSDNFYPATGGEVDLSEYAKIADVNSAFESLATALGGL